MHVPDEMNIGPVQAVAIVGAALRFPGASDPAEFHELSASGRRMFRPLAPAQDRGATDGDARTRARDKPAGRRSRLAALLDDETLRFGGDDELTGGVTARHILAAETAAAALADTPPAGRAVPPERIGVFIADIPEPGTANVRDWVHRQLRTLTPADLVATRTLHRDGAAGVPASRPASGGFHEFVLGAVGTAHPGGDTPRNGTAVVNGSAPGGLNCSLRAVAEACEALNAGEFDLVLVGGVARGIGHGPHGRTGPAPSAQLVRVYDRSPTGAFPGEGCGIVALTRAADARAL